MTRRQVYLALCLLGIVLPYSQLIPFLLEHGLNIRLFIDQLFGTRISSFFGLDVLVSSLVLWIFIGVEGRRSGISNLWAPRAAILLVGVSLALPLFLYLRERERSGAVT